MDCKKYMNQRKQMMETVSANVLEMGENISVNILLGFFPESYTCGMKEKYGKNMVNVVNAVIDFIIKTKRFN